LGHEFVPSEASHLYPDGAIVGRISAVDLLRHDSLGAEPASLAEYSRAIANDMVAVAQTRIGAGE
jgi:hypothetical protein